MVFSRKKNKPNPGTGTARMRGRDRATQLSGTTPGSVGNPLARRFQDDEPETIDLNQPPGFHETVDSPEDEPTTRIIAAEGEQADSSASAPLENPVAGFLVVIGGAGRGSVYAIAYGMNSIGRDSSQSVSLDHGDQGISRKNHCTVTFDSASGKFYVQPGEGRPLAYIDDEPVLVPTQLNTTSHIRLGSTVLRFVALCGDDFSWEM